MTNAITIVNLTKFYGSYRGVENINLEVKKGSIHGFLGPNGAGKTTTLRILVGLLSKSSGTAKIMDFDAGSLEAKKLIGYLPSDFELYSYYTVGEYLDYVEKLKGVAINRNTLVKRFNLDESRKTSELSKGNKQKVAIVQALMCDPDILIADEPTSGLDPLMQSVFDDVLREFVASGEKTVFISSHILSEVQNVCDNVTIISDGKIVSSGNVKELLASLPKKAILKVNKNTDGRKLSQKLQVNFQSQTDSDVTVLFENTKEFLLAVGKTEAVVDVIIERPSLEEYFMAYYR